MQRDGVVYVEFNNQQGLYLDGYKGLRLKATDHSVDFEIYATNEDEPVAYTHLRAHEPRQDLV